jgi:hypothetical protein
MQNYRNKLNKYTFFLYFYSKNIKQRKIDGVYFINVKDLDKSFLFITFASGK